MTRATGVLLTDLYQLTMLQGYHDTGMQETAVFEFFVRRLRPGRSFLIAAGLEQCLEFLEQLRFDPAELEWLATTQRFSADFLASLEGLRFTGDVHALQALPRRRFSSASEPNPRDWSPARNWSS